MKKCHQRYHQRYGTLEIAHDAERSKIVVSLSLILGSVDNSERQLDLAHKSCSPKRTWNSRDCPHSIDYCLLLSDCSSSAVRV